MPTVPTIEPFLVTVRTFRVSAHRTPLARVLGVNPRSRDTLERRLVRRIELEGAERKVVQASVHPRAVVDTVAHLFEVFKDDARLLELTTPLHDVSRHLVESVTDEPFLTPFQRVVDAVFPRVLDALPHREVAVALELDFGEVNNQRVLNAILGESGESHVAFVHVHTDDRPRVLLVSNGLFGVGDVDVQLSVVVVEQGFRRPNLPLIAFECGLENVEVGVTPFEDARDVLVRLRADAERHVAVVGERQVVPLLVVRSEGVCAVLGVTGFAEVVVLVVVLHRAECFGDDALCRVFHEVGVVGYTVGNRVPVDALLGETDGFVVHRPRFEGGVVQQALVVTLDVELEVQRLDESL